MGLAPLALYCFGYPFGFMAIVGTMGLIGVAINDSIVVLAAIREKSMDTEMPLGGERSVPVELAEVVGGSTRHILATTFTTMIGFLPLVLSGGKFWPPLAIVMSVGVGARHCWRFTSLLRSICCFITGNWIGPLTDRFTGLF